MQDLQTWKVRKMIQGKNFIQCAGGGTITISPFSQVAIGRSTKIVLRFLFVLNFCYYPKNFPAYCAQLNKGHCMVYWINTASPSQCRLGIPWRLEWLYPMYHIVWGPPQNTLQIGCICSAQFESRSGIIKREWAEGGARTKS